MSLLDDIERNAVVLGETSRRAVVACHADGQPAYLGFAGELIRLNPDGRAFVIRLGRTGELIVREVTGEVQAVEAD